jgi:hypothetical protein
VCLDRQIEEDPYYDSQYGGHAPNYQADNVDAIEFRGPHDLVWRIGSRMREYHRDLEATPSISGHEKYSQG